jgi:N-dimethylarginine dimethylaminohydrolase
VAIIDPDPALEDMVFAANPVFVCSWPQHGRFVVPGRMRFVSRRREVRHLVGWFRARGYEVLALDLGDDFLEGHGDLLWHPDGSKVWAGFGFRSSPGGIEKFAAALHSRDIPVIPLELVDENFYHLDTCFAPLNSQAALVYPAAFSAAALDTIRRELPRVYEVDRGLALRFVCNGVSANRNFLTPYLDDCLAHILRRENLIPVPLDTSEFEKSGGSLACLKLFFD